ncbi:fimbrial protein [Dickeya sp. CFBP 2040]|uniref:PilN domain-containing protein n=1 Tax=Dickeya sp. CFBP 2040 TaxID=2718531 RepID=UPI0014482FDC|nr:PilN domain-containing protein [Dickeya sp. CFBP 2040]NKI75664.1 fimbrial protein [Dickeya sp. CFBP 2040]
MLTVNLLAWRPGLLYRRIRLSLLVSGGLLFVVGCTATMTYRVYQQQQAWRRHKVELVQSQLPRYEQLYHQTLAAWQRREAQLAQLAVQEQSQQRNQRYQALLERLPALMPDSLWLTEIGDNGTRIHISGVSNHYSAIVTLANAMAALPQIEHASVQQTQRDPQDSARLNFSLRLHWRALAEAGSKG